MFNKNYDKEIDGLIASNNKTVKSVEEVFELISNLQDNIFKMAEIQGQHTEFIQFFVKHGTVSPDAQDDLIKMIHNMADISKLAEKGKKK